MVMYRGRGRGMPSAPDSAKVFAKFNGCDQKPDREELLDGKVHVDTWKGGAKGTRVTLYSLEGWGHGWPQARRKSIGASELIWKFFEAHGRKPKIDNKNAKKPRKRREGVDLFVNPYKK